MDMDHTQDKELNEALNKTNKQLEQKVEKLTTELEGLTQCLEDVNKALRVLLKQREDDRIELKESVLANINNFILPCLKKARKSRTDIEQQKYLDMVESFINDMVSPFVREVSSKYIDLTPTEIRYATLIKHGMTTKDIADLLCISENTVFFHRKNLRKKLKLENKKISLATYLHSLKL